MGNVLTTNIGPDGETYQYFYSCGPVVDPNNPEYYLDAAYEGQELCVKAGELEFGPLWEQQFAIGLVWFTIISSIMLFCYYLYETYKATCGWEEMYVVTAETLKVLIEMKFEFTAPAMNYQVNGVAAPWIRYAEWLLTCPVILIHLSNLTGLNAGYSKRTMFLLVSDLGCVVWGASSAFGKGSEKQIFFAIAVLYGMNTYFHAAKVYKESYHLVPKGRCKTVVMILAYMYFISWMGFPLAFIAGPEGSKSISYAGSSIVHTICDLASKNAWGFVANYLRRCIHKHIIMHGDIRKITTVNIAGEETEIHEYVEEEGEDTIKMSTEALAHRPSFIRMRDDMQRRGIQTRASLEFSGQQVNQFLNMSGMGDMGKGAMGPHIKNGRVILGVLDPASVEPFKMAFAQLPAQIELVPAMGPQNIYTTCQQAAGAGGFDFVLLHPEYLRDRSGSGLLAALKNSSVKVAAFGYEPHGFVKEVIEGAMVDGHISGPTMTGIDAHALLMLVARMQGTLHNFNMDIGQMGGYQQMQGGIPTGMGIEMGNTAVGDTGSYGGMGTQAMGGTMGMTGGMGTQTMGGTMGSVGGTMGMH